MRGTVPMKKPTSREQSKSYLDTSNILFLFKTFSPRKTCLPFPNLYLGFEYEFRRKNWVTILKYDI